MTVVSLRLPNDKILDLYVTVCSAFQGRKYHESKTTVLSVIYSKIFYFCIS